MSDHRNIPSFFQTGFDSPITEVAIMLVSEKDGKYLCLGSGVIIGHFIAMTARHVVDGFSQEHEGKAIERLGGEGTFSLRAIQFLENGSKALAWDVRHIYLNNDAGFTDIVFLRLQPTHQVHLDYRWKKVRMRLMPPRIGSIISGFGYHSTETEVSEGMVALNTNPVTTTGIVEEIHHERRDYSRLSFPCFRTDARFDRGMSGGPVFSEDGNLCGIICSNLPPSSSEEDSGHVSYVASLWTIMGILVSYNRDGYPHEIFYPAIELAQGGFIEAVDLEKVSVYYDGTNMTVRSVRQT